ncbi:MAG: hypothetical protein WC436_01985 [Candidatus Babeliales bacterium]
MDFKKSIENIKAKLCKCKKNNNKESGKCPSCNSKPCKCDKKNNNHKDNCKCNTCNCK